MTDDSLRILSAVAAVVLWLLTIGLAIFGAWRMRRAERNRSKALAGDGPGAVLIAYASQTGMAEKLAWMTARSMASAGHPARVVSVSDLDIGMLQAADRAFFVVSTAGEGDAPDSASRLVRTLMAEAKDLAGLSYGLLSLGDRSYQDFCGFGRAVDGWLRRSGAHLLFDPVEVDDGDQAAIRHWQHQINQLTGATTEPDWTPPAYDRWRLVERTHLNPGSPGGEAFHLALEPVGALPYWAAGDIAEVGAPTADGGQVSREYSIASLPADGRVELLVRLMRAPGGAPGLGSGWLTGTLAIGDDLPMRLRGNRAFHGVGGGAPMILIGNGTGLAGLRAHLKARAPGDAGAWLMFGERTRAHDAFFDADIQAWLASGVLDRLDRTFSRDAADGRYVQQLITDNADEVRARVDRGAAIFVCGSLDGMAAGVHAALETVLGADRLIELTETGRYRRDVY